MLSNFLEKAHFQNYQPKVTTKIQVYTEIRAIDSRIYRTICTLYSEISSGTKSRYIIIHEYYQSNWPDDSNK